MAWAKAIEQGKFDTQAYAKGMQAASQSNAATQSQPKSLWQRGWEWVKEKVVQPVRQVVLSRPQASQSGAAAQGGPKSWWQWAEEKITRGLIALGQRSPFAKRVLLTAATGWFRYGQPIVNATADFLGGFVIQTIQNNLDAFAAIAPMPPDVRQTYNNSWESIHSGRSVWYQAGRFTASLAGIVQGFWEIGIGVATASGGTIVSCGTLVFCFVGGGAAVVEGSVVAAHGALVTSASIINTVRSGQALLASAKSSAGTKNVLPDHPDAEIISSRTPRGEARDYEARALNKPDPNVAIKVNGVEFDWYEGDTLLDAKNAGEVHSWYDVSKPDNFTQDVKVRRIIDQAKRQIAALQGSGFNRIEWRVANPKVAEALQALFNERTLDIKVVYVP